ncbi:unnamed protein product, partial [marine sediment metagenome]
LQESTEYSVFGKTTCLEERDKTVRKGILMINSTDY